MAMQVEQLHWLDLALYFGRQIARPEMQEGNMQMKLDERRKHRVEKGLKVIRLSEDQATQLKTFAVLVAAWFDHLPAERKLNLDPTLLAALQQFNELPQLAEQESRTIPELINRFLERTDALPEMEETQDGLTFRVPNGGLNGMSTRPWYDYIQSNQPITQCQHCGVPFVSSRTHTKYHSAGCRSSASKERKK